MSTTTTKTRYQTAGPTKCRAGSTKTSTERTGAFTGSAAASHHSKDKDSSGGHSKNKSGVDVETKKRFVFSSNFTSFRVITYLQKLGYSNATSSILPPFATHFAFWPKVTYSYLLTFTKYLTRHLLLSFGCIMT